MAQNAVTLIPHLVVSPAAEAIEFYKRAFGFEELHRMPGPDGKAVMHAQLRLGDAQLMLADEFDCGPASQGFGSPRKLGGTTSVLHLQVPDVDAAFAQAIAAGGTAIMPPTDMFWGDRYGQLRDPFGHRWSVATTKEKLTPEQMRERGQAAMASFNK